MKYIINEFTDGTGFFSDDNRVLYEVVTEDYSEQYDVLWVFTSGTWALTNKTSTVDANGQIVGLGSASTITLSQTIPKIFIRRTVGSYDAWFE